MKYKGTIFKLPFPFTDLSGQKARPALAISEPDEYGDVEFLFITTKQPRKFSKTIDMASEVYASAKLPFDSILHLDKGYLLSKDIVIKELSFVTESFMEKVLRERAIMN